MPKHFGEFRHGSSPRRAWRLALPAAAVIGGVAIGLLGVGGSYALWTASADANVGHIEAGTIGLTAQWASGHDDAAWSNLLPGESVRQDLALANTGDAQLAIFASTLGITSGFEVRIAAGACTTAALTADTSGPNKAPLGVAATPDTPIIIGAGQSAPACLEVRALDDAANTAAPGQTVAFATEFEGRQVQ